ncbi:hypothetical protein EAF00_005863 [Botryotinia globosa]|nr:hypothetical protein EAF00_005863 [Botryotinia globosa]
MLTSNQSDVEFRCVLQQRRKKNNKTSCYPCRTRKVKCDRCHPCKNCSIRGYSELCSFAETVACESSSHNAVATSRRRSSIDHSAQNQRYDDSAALPQKAQPESLTLSEINRESLENCSSSGINASTSSLPRNFEALPDRNSDVSDQHESFIGINSIPAFIRNGQSEDHDSLSKTVEDAIMPILGLKDAKASYPFLPTIQMTTETSATALDGALPPDRKIIHLFEIFCAQPHAFSPIVTDIQAFEAEICLFLEKRAIKRRQRSIIQNSGDYQNLESQNSMSWHALLFAVLASGEQCCNDNVQERQTASQNYIRYSFQCLRIAKFLLTPSPSSVQTLLVIGNVL